MKFDLTSFLAGASIAIGTLLLSGATGAVSETGSDLNGSATGTCCCRCGEYGRYALSFSGSRAYLLDRQTGQVWEKFAPANAVGSSSDFNEPKQ